MFFFFNDYYLHFKEAGTDGSKQHQQQMSCFLVLWPLLNKNEPIRTLRSALEAAEGSPTRRDLQLAVLTQTFDRTEVDFPNDVLWLFCTLAFAANEDSLLRLIIYDNAAHLMHRHKVLIKSSAAPFISPPPAALRAMEPFYHNEPGAERG